MEKYSTGSMGCRCTTCNCALVDMGKLCDDRGSVLVEVALFLRASFKLTRCRFVWPSGVVQRCSFVMSAILERCSDKRHRATMHFADVTLQVSRWCGERVTLCPWCPIGIVYFDREQNAVI